MPGQQSKNDGQVVLSEHEYLSTQRLIGAFTRLESEAELIVSRYAPLVATEGLERALNEVNEYRRRIHDSTHLRYGWDDDT